MNDFVMKIGIISDTHDDIENVKEVIQRFKKEKVGLIVHAGDYIFPGVIEEFKASLDEDTGSSKSTRKIKN